MIANFALFVNYYLLKSHFQYSKKQLIIMTMENIDIGATLRRLRHEKNMTRLDVHEALGGILSVDSIRRMEEENKTFSVEKLKMLAGYFGVSIADLFLDAEGLNKLDPEIAQTKRVPVISWVKAGDWSQSPVPAGNLNEFDSVIAPAKAGKNSYALTVTGDSMQAATGMSFPDGCIIIVDPDRQAQNKDYVIATYEDTGDCTFKQLLIDGPHKILKALNPTFPPIQINGNAIITGVVISMQWTQP